LSWHTVTMNEGGEGDPYVRLGATSRDTRAGYCQMELQLSATFAHFLSVRAGDRVKLDTGALANEGWMRVSKGKNQKVCRHGHAGSIRIRFSGRWLCVKSAHRPEKMPYRVDRVDGVGHVHFQLPQWARKKGLERGTSNEEHEPR
jgi:hypothetical protein